MGCIADRPAPAILDAKIWDIANAQTDEDENTTIKFTHIKLRMKDFKDSRPPESEVYALLIDPSKP